MYLLLLWACVPLIALGVCTSSILVNAAGPAQLHLKQDGLYAWQAGFLGGFFVRHVVLPFDAEDGAQAAFVKLLQ